MTFVIRKRCAWIARYIPDYVHIPKERLKSKYSSSKYKRNISSKRVKDGAWSMLGKLSCTFQNYWLWSLPQGSWRKMFHDDYPLPRLNWQFKLCYPVFNSCNKCSSSLSAGHLCLCIQMRSLLSLTRRLELTHSPACHYWTSPSVTSMTTGRDRGILSSFTLYVIFKSCTYWKSKSLWQSKCKTRQSYFFNAICFFLSVISRRNFDQK